MATCVLSATKSFWSVIIVNFFLLCWIQDEVITALEKTYCERHFECQACQRSGVEILRNFQISYKLLRVYQIQSQFWFLSVLLKMFLTSEILTPDYCRLNLKKKFVELDMKPICVKCFDKFPGELKKRIKKNNAKKYWTRLPLIFNYVYPSVLYFLHIPLSPLFAFTRTKSVLHNFDKKKHCIFVDFTPFW